MSFATTALSYGWRIAAGITLAAATIYVANNTRQRVNQADVVELALGFAERCMIAYPTTMPEDIPFGHHVSWYSNSYESSVTNGLTNWVAVLYTNLMTNVVGWRTDRTMISRMDAVLRGGVVSRYVDTNTVFDVMTNLPTALTFTGLMVNLQIGNWDHEVITTNGLVVTTNAIGTLFTATPPWVGTNGLTNAATYGELPQRIYTINLVERYKILNALKVAAYHIHDDSYGGSYTFEERWASGTNYADAVVNFAAAPWYAETFENAPFAWCSGGVIARGRYAITVPYRYQTNLLVQSIKMFRPIGTSFFSTNYLSGEIDGQPGEWRAITNFVTPIPSDFPKVVQIGFIDGPVADPSPLADWGWSWSGSYTNDPSVPRTYHVVECKFLYCTNKFW